MADLQEEDANNSNALEEEGQPAQPQDSSEYRTAIKRFLGELPSTNTSEFNLPRLKGICGSLDIDSPAVTLDKLSIYLRDTFPPKKRDTRNRARQQGTRILTRRQERKAEYAKVQDLWRKQRGKCLRMLLNDISNVSTPSKETMVPFWREVMTASKDTSPGMDHKRPIVEELWAPVTEHEIRKALPNAQTAAGPDSITARQMKKIPAEVLVRISNLILWCEKAPLKLLESVTTLIPKKSRASEPADFRPITVSSVLIRTLHKVLAARMSRLVHLDQRQRAFRPTDGCSDNVFLLDMILRYHHRQHKPLYVASLDIAKAFDSVSHETLSETLEIMGTPPPMIAYIKDVYERSSTTLVCDGWTSDSIQPRCGVKQGDPMSPFIFNMVIERLLTRLPDDIGAKIGSQVINAAAFADDLLLFATTPMGLQKLLNEATRFLKKCGLQVNASKCMSVALRNVPHEKKTVVDKETVFLCENRVLPSLKRTDEWIYLGVPFTPEGRMRNDVSGKLIASIQKLSKAPLKPQQRMFALRTMVIPGLYHQLELGNTNISILRRCDKILRHAVRMWLCLPADTPNAYIHASVRNGGLGISSLRWTVPLRRLQRLTRLPLANEQARGTPGAFLNQEIAKCTIRLRDGHASLESRADIEAWWAKRLYSAIDGIGLKEAAKVPQQNNWVSDGTKFLTGKDYLQACRLRINALPTRSRTTRGRPDERMCRGGCNRVETLNHVLQQCHRTHGPRTKRHDAVVAYVVRSLQRAEYEVWVEPKLKTLDGIRKPDIVARRGVHGVVIDAQVINDQYDLGEAHENKIKYYRNIETNIKSTYEVQHVTFTSATLSWRGLWSEASATSLLDLGVIRKRELKILSTRAIIGGLCAFYQFGKTTMVETRRSRRRGLSREAQNERPP